MKRVRAFLVAAAVIVTCATPLIAENGPRANYIWFTYDAIYFDSSVGEVNPLDQSGGFALIASLRLDEDPSAVDRVTFIRRKGGKRINKFVFYKPICNEPSPFDGSERLYGTRLDGPSDFLGKWEVIFYFNDGADDEVYVGKIASFEAVPKATGLAFERMDAENIRVSWVASVGFAENADYRIRLVQEGGCGYSIEQVVVTEYEPTTNRVFANIPASWIGQKVRIENRNRAGGGWFLYEGGESQMSRSRFYVRVPDLPIPE